MTTISTVAAMIRQAETHSASLAQDRIRAVEYYNGEMSDTPANDGRSHMVSRDVRAQIKKALPSIIRTILGNEKVVEFQPVSQGDEPGAEQATDYFNHVVLADGDVVGAIEDAIHDAMLIKNGVLRWYWDATQRVSYSDHTGLPDPAYAELVADEDVEVLEHSERQEQIETPEGVADVTVHDCRIKRVAEDGRLKICAVPHERFLIHPDATCVEDSAVVGEMTRVTRSELIAMGYDRELVEGLPASGEEDAERVERRGFAAGKSDEDTANEPVDYYDVYVRADLDDDGIAELHHMVFAGGLTEESLLVDEPCDEAQFCTIRVQRRPHQWEGVSIADDVMDIQRAKTVLLRGTADNIYWQNNPQPVYQEGVILNEDALFNPEFGLPIRVKPGTPSSEAYSFQTIPFIASDSFAMMQYFDQEAQDRTGITDAASGLAPDALQNMTAKASAMVEQAGIGQIEQMVRTVARDLKPFFKGTHRCIIRHQDVERTVRLRGQWVTFDPRQWNADMDCEVNVGLGAGTRERDMMAMNQVMMLQKTIGDAFGLDSPLLNIEHIAKAAHKFLESAGLKSPDKYIGMPSPQEAQAFMRKMAQKPSKEQMQMQADMAVEKAKLEAATQKEKAQMVADMQVAAADRQTQMAVEKMKIDWDREKLLIEQRAMLAPHGLQMGEDGKPVNQAQDAVIAMMHQTQAMIASLGQALAAANAPKRVVRDANGEIIGMEPVTAPVRVN